MKIVLLESLGISQEILSGFAQQLEKQGHQFVSYEKNTDEQVQIERAQDADILIIANMPLSGRVIPLANSCASSTWHSPAWTMWIWKLPKKWASRSAMQQDIPPRRSQSWRCA